MKAKYKSIAGIEKKKHTYQATTPSIEVINRIIGAKQMHSRVHMATYATVKIDQYNNELIERLKIRSLTDGE